MFGSPELQTRTVVSNGSVSTRELLRTGDQQDATGVMRTAPVSSENWHVDLPTANEKRIFLRAHTHTHRHTYAVADNARKRKSFTHTRICRPLATLSHRPTSPPRHSTTPRRSPNHPPPPSYDCRLTTTIDANLVKKSDEPLFRGDFTTRLRRYCTAYRRTIKSIITRLLIAPNTPQWPKWWGHLKSLAPPQILQQLTTNYVVFWHKSLFLIRISSLKADFLSFENITHSQHFQSVSAYNISQVLAKSNPYTIILTKSYN